MGSLRIKRIYDPAAESDGYRILVDRLWPRGMTRDRAELEEWRKDVAPSSELRSWWNHDPARFADFSNRYRSELSGSAGIDELLDLIDAHEQVTLLYAARDPEINHAAVLRDYLLEHQEDGGSGREDSDRKD